MPQVAVVPRTPAPTTRCAYCHGEAGPHIRPCVTCGALLHPECWLTAGRCPTLGCRIVVRRTGSARGRAQTPGRRRARRMAGLELLAALGMLTTVGAIAYDSFAPPPRPVRAHRVTHRRAAARERPADMATRVADVRFRASFAFESWFSAPPRRGDADLGAVADQLDWIPYTTFEDERLRGFVHLVRGERDAAAAAFEGALRFRPRDLFTVAWLTSLDRSVSLEGPAPVWLTILRRAQSNREVEGWAAEVTEALSSPVDRCALYTHLAVLAETRGEAQRAEALYRKAARIREPGVGRYWQHRLATARDAARRRRLRD